MNISMQLAAVLVVAACICLADGAPDGRLVRTKQQRPTRGFKNVEMMTARGFGKRDKSNIKSDLLNADDFSEILGPAPEKEIMETTDDKTADSMPVELFVMEMLNHPELARSVVNKFIDLDQDGMLSLEELFRNRA